jgi:putative hydrolase of the HAD superfamily
MPIRADFAHIDSWIFDLDNTLYPATANLFALIDIKMGEYVGKLLGCDPIEARATQKRYFMEHGTTLSGLMLHHGIDPREFLDYVHDIDMSHIGPDVELCGHIAELPGRKLIFTNGDVAYARRVLERLGLGDHFELIHDIHACIYRPKPDPHGYHLLRDLHGIELARAAFFEDMARNLKPAKALGMTTIWVNNGSEGGRFDAHADFIDHETAHLTPFLASVLGEHLKCLTTPA